MLLSRKPQSPGSLDIPVTWTCWRLVLPAQRPSGYNLCSTVSQPHWRKGIPNIVLYPVVAYFRRLRTLNGHFFIRRRTRLRTFSRLNLIWLPTTSMWKVHWLRYIPRENAESNFLTVTEFHEMLVLVWISFVWQVYLSKGGQCGTLYDIHFAWWFLRGNKSKF